MCVWFIGSASYEEKMGLNTVLGWNILETRSSTWSSLGSSAKFTRMSGWARLRYACLLRFAMFNFNYYRYF